MKIVRRLMMILLCAALLGTFALASAANYAQLYYATEGEDIAVIQRKLMSLGYPVEAADGVYDMELQESIEAFCQRNFIPYDRATENGISPALQAFLLDEDSIPYRELSFSERLHAEFSKTTHIFGLVMPVTYFYFAEFLLLVILILLVFYLLRRRKAPQMVAVPMPSRHISTPMRSKNSVRFTIEFG